MTFRLRCVNPDEIKFRLEVTLTLKEWQQIREVLNCGHGTAFDGYEPSGQLRRAVDDVIEQAGKVYRHESESGAAI